MDLASSWRKALAAWAPHARVVFDRFHVERLAADAVDEVRRAEQRRLAPAEAKALKGARYALLKRPDRLKPGEVRRLKTLRRANRALDRACELKDYLAMILGQATSEGAQELLDEWLEWALRRHRTGAAPTHIHLRRSQDGVWHRQHSLHSHVGHFQLGDQGRFQAWGQRGDIIYEQAQSNVDVRAGDVLMVKDGTYLIGATAIVTEFDLPMLFQSHLYRIRVRKPEIIDPWLLFALLNTPVVRRQIRAKQFTQDIIDTIGKRVSN